MKKEKYERPDINVIWLEKEDVVQTSGDWTEIYPVNAVNDGKWD